MIDYGGSATDVYGPHRMHGTLLAYRGHRVVSDPYADVGTQDLTAHVDFTSVEREARGSGLDVLGRTTQAEFLTGLGLGELLRDIGSDPGTSPQAYATARASVLRLLDPRHLGRFNVLVLARGPADVAVQGLSFRLPAR